MDKSVWQQIQRIGSACYRLGLSREENPYPEASEMAKAWIVGWNVQRLGDLSR